VRELSAVIERAVILGDGKRIDVAAALGGQSPSLALRIAPTPEIAPLPERADVAGSVLTHSGNFPTLDEAMSRHIEDALRKSHGRIEGPFGAARLLQINPHTLRGRMRTLGLDWRRFRSSAPG
jgi:transcriptional regulator with GAF, ATPase, and Fis domain